MVMLETKKALRDLCNPAPIAETTSDEALISVAKVLNNFGLDTTNSGKNSENLQGGEDVGFRVAPSGYSADRYTTKEGKKVGFSSRLGKLRPLKE